jgi:hypothetical protein
MSARERHQAEMEAFGAAVTGMGGPSSARVARLVAAARSAGLLVRMRSPGDGKTRYTFFRLEDVRAHGLSEDRMLFSTVDSLFTADGIMEAEVFVRGALRSRFGADVAFGGLADIRMWWKKPSLTHAGRFDYRMLAAFPLEFTIAAKYPKGYALFYRRSPLASPGPLYDADETDGVFYATPQAAARAAAIRYERATGKSAKEAFGRAEVGASGDVPAFPRSVGGSTLIQYPGFSFKVTKVGKARYDLDWVPVKGAVRQLAHAECAETVRRIIDGIIQAVNDNLRALNKGLLESPFRGENLGAAPRQRRLFPRRRPRNKVHLLPTRGTAAACGVKQPATAVSDINLVTCPNCLAVHEAWERARYSTGFGATRRRETKALIEKWRVPYVMKSRGVSLEEARRIAHDPNYTGATGYVTLRNGRRISYEEALRRDLVQARETGKLIAYHGTGSTGRTMLTSWSGLPIAVDVRTVSTSPMPRSWMSDAKVFMRFRAPWDDNRIWSGFTMGPGMYGHFRRTKSSSLDGDVAFLQASAPPYNL